MLQVEATTRTPRKATLAPPWWPLARRWAIPRCSAHFHDAQGERGLAHSGRPGDHRPPSGRDGPGQLGELLASAYNRPPGHIRGYLDRVVAFKGLIESRAIK